MIKVLSSGFYTSIQDFGRNGYQQFGVPISGAMDQRAAAIANALVGNTGNKAVLEITMSGPKLQFEVDTAIALAGANITPQLNGKPIRNNHFKVIKAGDVLSFGKLVSGFRCYLAVFGGFQTEHVLGSKSMYSGITKANTIQKDDILSIETAIKRSNNHFSALKVKDDYLQSLLIEVVKGPEFENLSPLQQELLLSNKFTVSKENSRMAYQLQELLENKLQPIITSPVMPGTVQLTPSGKLIVLMQDCQTTGGYPRVLQLTENSINVLAQKYTGNSVSFKLKN